MSKVEYKNTLIKDIGRVVTGKTPETKKAEFYGNGYMFITPAELHDGYNVQVSDKYITESGLQSIKSNCIDGTSVMVGCIGWDMGNVAICHRKCATNQQINSITDFNPKYNPFYTYYWLLTKKDYLFTIASVTRTPILSKSTFEEIVIPMPDRSIQDNVVGILKPIDDMIENNKRICSELEAMAKTLYDYWFVQFDFPDENGKPYRTSGGEMKWNEQLKREIPKGWNVTTINDMTHSYRGVSYDKKDLLPTAENGILVLRGNNIQNNRLVYDANVAYVPCSLVSKEQQIQAHDIILTMSSGSKEHIGKCTMFQYDSPHTYGAFLTKFTPESDKVGFVYLSMISDFFKKKIQAICNGTGINNLTNETFDNLVFPKPDKTILGYFEEIVAPLFEKMGECDRENEELTKLRDWLLPMLMNGQARVE